VPSLLDRREAFAVPGSDGRQAGHLLVAQVPHTDCHGVEPGLSDGPDPTVSVGNLDLGLVRKRRGRDAVDLLRIPAHHNAHGRRLQDAIFFDRLGQLRERAVVLPGLVRIIVEAVGGNFECGHAHRLIGRPVKKRVMWSAISCQMSTLCLSSNFSRLMFGP